MRGLDRSKRKTKVRLRKSKGWIEMEREPWGHRRREDHWECIPWDPCPTRSHRTLHPCSISISQKTGFRVFETGIAIDRHNNNRVFWFDWSACEKHRERKRERETEAKPTRKEPDLRPWPPIPPL